MSILYALAMLFALAGVVLAGLAVRSRRSPDGLAYLVIGIVVLALACLCAALAWLVGWW